MEEIKARILEKVDISKQLEALELLFKASELIELDGACGAVGWDYVRNAHDSINNTIHFIIKNCFDWMNEYIGENKFYLEVSGAGGYYMGRKDCDEDGVIGLPESVIPCIVVRIEDVYDMFDTILSEMWESTHTPQRISRRSE